MATFVQPWLVVMNYLDQFIVVLTLIVVLTVDHLLHHLLGETRLLLGCILLLLVSTHLLNYF